jgi:hypothetical protein
LGPQGKIIYEESKPNEELDKLIKHKNIINYIKAQKSELIWSRTEDAGYQDSQEDI